MKRSFFKVFNTYVFQKLFAGFLLVSIPFYAISLTVLWIGSEVVYKETRDASQAKLQFFIGFLEEELRNSNQMMIALNGDPDIQAFCLKLKNDETSFDKVLLYRSIISKMKIVFFSNENITDVFLLIPGQDTQLSYIDGLDKLDDQMLSILEKHKFLSSQINRFVQNDSLIYSMEFPYREPGNGEDNPAGIYYVLGVKISQNLIVNSLQKYNDNSKFHLFLVDNRSRTTLAEKTLSELDMEIYQGLGDVTSDRNTNELTVGGEEYMVQFGTTGDNVFTLVSYSLKRDILSPLLFFTRLLWIILASSFITFLIYTLLVFKSVQNPLNYLVKSMKEVEAGNLNIVLDRERADEFGYVYRQFNRMLQKTRILVQEVLEKKIQVQQAEMKQLQAQINPHFLFNCFYLGYRMAKSGDNENVAKLCKYLGDYFRFITRHSQTEIRLKDELDYTVAYLEIQKLRFSNRMDYSIEFEEGLYDFPVPSLILQPIVENSLLHGLEKVKNPGCIQIRIQSKDNSILVSVEDNGPGMSEEQKRSLESQLDGEEDQSGHCGLWNVQHRLMNKFGDNCRLELAGVPGGGFRVSFSMPRQGGGNHVSLVDR